MNGASGKPTDRHYGRFQTLNHFVDFTMSKLSRAEVAVWMILFRDTKKDGTARVAQADMARRAGADDRTMRRALRRLIGLRLVSVVRQGGLGRGPSTYRVNTNPPSW
ncbi:MAG: helix-turn-helix domain-containing protein [Pirellulales bacterium]|nr:helix-turn-helix domain-containing protein [Pirellulales bacterium]